MNKKFKNLKHLDMRRPSVNDKPKVLVIAGPTASGKTGLAVHIAKKFNGEIISADSRQVYKHLNIGTEKATKKEMQGVPHHLLDIASPKRAFTASQFKKLSEKAINKILKKEKLPIIAGGTGFYIDALVENQELPDVKPNTKARKEMEKLSCEELFKKLKKLDPNRAKEIDPQNKRRLIRSIEIAEAIGKVPNKKNVSKYNALKIGIKTDDKILKERIENRLGSTIKKGLIKETKNLRNTLGLSWKRINELGLEYRIVAKYIHGEITKSEMIQEMKTKLWQYAKRQKTWFKRDKEIEWFALDEIKKIEGRVKKFLN